MIDETQRHAADFRDSGGSSFNKDTVMRVGALDPRLRFYRACIDEFVLDKGASILVVAGGQSDKKVIESLGFVSVAFSNVDPVHAGAEQFAPYEFSHQDAEALSYPDESFDYVLVHAGLHHCHSPHRALLEMYRVSRLGVLAVEARDSVTTRLLEHVGLVEAYEVATVRNWGGACGGVCNGPIPNFVYRWTEREVEKTIKSFAPDVVQDIRYRYGNDVPNVLKEPRSIGRKVLVGTLFGGYKLLTMAFRRQQNLFCFFVAKRNELQPWLEAVNGAIRVKRPAEAGLDRQATHRDWLKGNKSWCFRSRA